MQWRPNNDYAPMQKVQLGKFRDNPDYRLGITMYNKVNVHFDLLVSRDIIPEMVLCSDSAVPKLKPNNRGYLILAERKEQEDIDLATAISQSKSTAKNSDIEISKMVDESKSDGSGS